MAETTFRYGDPLMTDYTPGGAIAAGEVVVLATAVGIAHLDIAASELGAISAGGGVYDTIADGALAAGAKVYWDDTANKVTATATANKMLGHVESGSSSAADGDTIRVVHSPGH